MKTDDQIMDDNYKEALELLDKATSNECKLYKKLESCEACPFAADPFCAIRVVALADKRRLEANKSRGEAA
jgi:hypothetical protein